MSNKCSPILHMQESLRQSDGYWTRWVSKNNTLQEVADHEHQERTERTSTSCADDDEFAFGTDTCHAEATCMNTVGNFTCTCNAGHSGSGTICTDHDVCAFGTTALLAMCARTLLEAASAPQCGLLWIRHGLHCWCWVPSWHSAGYSGSVTTTTNPYMYYAEDIGCNVLCVLLCRSRLIYGLAGIAP